MRLHYNNLTRLCVVINDLYPAPVIDWTNNGNTYYVQRIKDGKVHSTVYGGSLREVYEYLQGVLQGIALERWS